MGSGVGCGRKSARVHGWHMCNRKAGVFTKRLRKMNSRVFLGDSGSPRVHLRGSKAFQGKG